MSGRPWYVQSADLLHRLTVLGILGYSGYLCYGIGRAINHNYENKKRKQLLDNQSEPSQSDDQNQ